MLVFTGASNAGTSEQESDALAALTRGAPAPYAVTQKVAFTAVPGPAADTRNIAQHLTDRQLAGIRAFLAPCGRNLPPQSAELLLDRVVSALSTADFHYKREISTEEWDKILQKLRDDFLRRHGEPAQTSFDRRGWENAISGILRGLVIQLEDPYGGYEAGTSRGSLGSFTARGPAGLRLHRVIPDSPADKAGLADNDEILAINGHSLRGLDYEEMREILRDAPEGPLQLQILRAGKEFSATVRRGTLPDLPPLAKMAAKGIGYVHFRAFESRTDEKIFAAIESLRKRGADMLILDVRGNMGGNTEAARSITSEFLEDGQQIDTMRFRGELAETTKTKGRGRYADLPLAVLVDGDSASSSELLASALQEHRRALIIGSRTYGKGSFQSTRPNVVGQPKPGEVLSSGEDDPMPYFDGTSLTITEGSWHTPGGRSVQGRYDRETGRNVPDSGGVVPDVRINLDPEESAAVSRNLLLEVAGRPSRVRDRVLEKAIELLRSEWNRGGKARI